MPFALTMAPILSMGKITPVSLFATMIDTNAVSSVSARNSSRSSIPSCFTLSQVTRYPRFSRCWHSPKTAGCSTCVVTMWRLSDRASSIPRMAALSPSVPQLVKIISIGSAAPINAATCARFADFLRYLSTEAMNA